MRACCGGRAATRSMRRRRGVRSGVEQGHLEARGGGGGARRGETGGTRSGPARAGRRRGRRGRGGGAMTAGTRRGRGRRRRALPPGRMEMRRRRPGSRRRAGWPARGRPWRCGEIWGGEGGRRRGKRGEGGGVGVNILEGLLSPCSFLVCFPCFAVCFGFADFMGLWAAFGFKLLGSRGFGSTNNVL